MLCDERLHFLRDPKIYQSAMTRTNRVTVSLPSTQECSMVMETGIDDVITFS